MLKNLKPSGTTGFLLLNNKVTQRYIDLKQFTEGIPRDIQYPQGPKEAQKIQIHKEGQDSSNN